MSDLIIRNGRVWTGMGRAEAVLIRGDRIERVGDERSVLAEAPPGAIEIDLAGRLLVPGFVDAHNHIRLGSGDGAVQLAGATTLAEIRWRIENWVLEHPAVGWIHGEGFDYAAMPGGRHPQAFDLDGVADSVPIMLLDYSVHAAWLNRAALTAFGIARGTGDVAWGTVERDVDGEPTGYVADFATRGLSARGAAALAAVSPAYGEEARYLRVVSGLRMAAGYGITTVVEPQNSPEDLKLFARARDEGVLPNRLVAAMFHPPGTGSEEVEAFDEARRTFDDDRLRVGPIKLYIDDIVEPHTAAMFEPYSNRPDTSGRTYYEPSEFADVVSALDARGFQCFVHATGDRGISTALDAFAEARRRNGARDSRHQIVHVECMRAADIPRFAELGVVACMQPRHCSPDIVDQWRENVGERRWRHAWPMRSLHRSGAVLAFSSDWNVAEMDPVVGLYSAVTRASLDGRRSWVTEECVDIETAMRAYTHGSAYSVFADHDRGAIEPGMLADVVVLSDDVFALAPEALLSAKVDMTMVGGEIVHMTG